MIFEAITAVGISLGSWHIPHTDQTQFNPGIHVEEGNVRYGAYRNSHSKLAAYVGYTIPLWSSPEGNFRAGALVALSSGYPSPVIGDTGYQRQLLTGGTDKGNPCPGSRLVEQHLFGLHRIVAP